MTVGISRAEEAAIAQIKKVIGQATILRSGERRPASVGDKLFVKDVIETGSEGTIGITFIDNTVFSTGPDSQIALDAFEFDSTIPRLYARRYEARNLGRQTLSLGRAAALRDRLVRDGIEPDAISVAGRGKLDLIVPTADGVSEPRNRCVVITVR